jgi:PIN domain nuclease of toxin-antitoxin system
MNLLLDTHVFLWYISGDRRLPELIRDHIRDQNNIVYLSVVSVWEVMIKYQLGKLPLPESPESYLPLQREKHQIESLTLDEMSVARLSGLPNYHRDPFDRILICQALRHDLVIATVDSQMHSYAVQVLL